MRTVTIVDKNNPRVTRQYSAEPTDYALGIPWVLMDTEELLRRSRLRPDGFYVPDAVDDQGESRHPVHFRAERYSIKGALYRAANLIFPPEVARLRLHGPTLFHITQHHLRVAAECVRDGRQWPTHTLRAEPGVTCRVVSPFPLQDLEREESEVIFEVIRTAGENVDSTYRQLEGLGDVAIPWPHRDAGWNLEDHEPTRR